MEKKALMANKAKKGSKATKEFLVKTDQPSTLAKASLKAMSVVRATITLTP